MSKKNPTKPSHPQLPLFVVCGPGLEPLLHTEILDLGIPEARTRLVPGGIEVEGDLQTLYRLNLEVGLSLKVLVRVAEFPARRFDVLVKRASSVPWEAWVGKDTAIDLRANCKSSKLYHSGAVIERVHMAIEDRLGHAVKLTKDETGEHALAIHARLVNDVCTLSIDSSGELLSRRGYRHVTSKAPLREDLARALLIASEWDRQSPVLDPFCGSGTILIEADWLARNVPPGHLRHFAFMHAPNFDAALWDEVRQKALAQVRVDGPPVFGSDRDRNAVTAARTNSERAGVKHATFSEAPLSKAPFFLDPVASSGAVVTNPPYGKRVGHDPTLDSLYRALGEKIRSLPYPCRVGLAVASPDRARKTGLPLSPALMTDHGGSKIYFAVGSNLS